MSRDDEDPADKFGGQGANQPATVSQWLRCRTPQHLAMLDGMRSRLHASLDALPERRIPDRDWARIYGLYQAGYHALLTEERERARLALLARRLGGNQPLSDAEYDAEMRQLAMEAVLELPAGELDALLKRRAQVS